ncbi:MAG: chloride channel protein [Lachnospiraceae bacterium]|nr:chloride channel protein [Lachnospiraceae bacterium]
MIESVKSFINNYQYQLKTSLKWILFALISGVLIGFVGIAFYYGMDIVTGWRAQYPWLIFLLPGGGLAIAGLYRLLHNEKDTGTNLVLSAIHSNDNIPLRMAPLIFVSTLITHLFGGSAGREGAALQLGGSIGNALGKLFRFDEKDQHTMIMCGMSAAFSALFGTPLAAAFFSMEVVSVGIMHYSALVPCVIAALVAHGIAVSCGAVPESFDLGAIPAFSPKTAILIGILAVLCALVSILFCVILHTAERFYKRFFRNTYLRAAVGGCIVIALTLLAGSQNYNGTAMSLIGSQDYNGTGMSLIAQCFSTENVFPLAFLLKMIFTAATLAAGYKGGEIVPTFCVGATFGCLFGSLVGLSPSLCAAVGMGAVFCGVTNSPVTALLICFELFGFKGMPYYLIAIALSYMMSGYYGLYSSQKIIYSKYKTEYINRKTN